MRVESWIRHAMSYVDAFLLITSAVRNAVVTDDFVAHLETMLRRGGIIAHLACCLTTSGQHTGDLVPIIGSQAGR